MVPKISEDNLGQFETFVSPVKGSLKVSDFVLVKYSVAGTSKSKISDIYLIGQIIKVILNTILQVSFIQIKYSANCVQYTFCW